MSVLRFYKRAPLFLKIVIIGKLVLSGILLFALVALTVDPAAGAYSVDFLRQIIGDQSVANIETTLFEFQDTVKQAELRLGLLHPENPFGQAPAPVASLSTAGSSLKTRPLVTALQKSTITGNHTAASGSKSTAQAAKPPVTRQAVPLRAGQTWEPGPVTSLGQQPGEGTWLPYLKNPAGQTVALRTFVAPDPTRPYAQVGVVAFDLRAIRLHYVIGFQQPYAPDVQPFQPGQMDSADLNSPALLAAFNGGFKYMHGHFGSMSGGFVSAPPRDGLGTVAVYSDGTVKIGAWGADIQPSADLSAYRQNGPLVIQNGQRTTQVDNPDLWGHTLSGGTVTWRSGLGISADGQTLYYFAGPSLSIRSLADAMLAAHVNTAIQLDINNYWVHFVGIQATNAQPSITALFPKEMAQGKDRYLYAYSRDFFYVTAASK